MKNTVNNIQFKHKSCVNLQGNFTEIEENQISLYVVMTRKCNTNCRFCEYHSGKSDIDIEKFSKTLDWLLSFCDITTVHFTGGEPTLEIEKFKQILKVIKSKDKLIDTSVNTNGTNLKLLENIEELDNIALSRHAISDNENQQVFRSSLVPTIEDISKFNEPHKLHLSCNLIKGYVDSKDKIHQYLELAASLNINDVGVVSLMGVNEYCKNNYVDFSKLNVTSIENIKKVRGFCNRDSNTDRICCKCENYLYRASNMNLISMYHRYAIRNNEVADYLVYEDNNLKQGFSGHIIDITY